MYFYHKNLDFQKILNFRAKVYTPAAAAIGDMQAFSTLFRQVLPIFIGIKSWIKLFDI